MEKIINIGKPLSELTESQRKHILINKIRDEKGVIITDTEKIQIIIRTYNKNQVEKSMDNILNAYHLSKVKSQAHKKFKQTCKS